MENLTLQGIVGLLIALGLVLGGNSATADRKLAIDQVKGDLSVMVLGSGGPVATPAGRASAGYLVFVDGQPKILMDVGGGVFQRLAESGANIADLDIILLSHLHIDHMGDLSPIIKTTYFHARGKNLDPDSGQSFPPGRTAPIRIYGPDENGIGFPPAVFPDATEPQYPPTTGFVHDHYDLNEGTDRYLNIFSRAIRGGVFGVEAFDYSPTLGDPMQTILDEDGLVVKTIAVNHGPGALVPALAFRIEYKGKSIVYSGDTSSVTDNMIVLAQDADVLIYDTAIMDDAPSPEDDPVFFALHTTPTRLGQVAVAAGARRLVLSHITPVTEGRLGEVKEIVRAQGYRGKVRAARDLMVINVDAKGRDKHPPVDRRKHRPDRD
jgi:ribonuclease BN (tRNA processing enzyme)